MKLTSPTYAPNPPLVDTHIFEWSDLGGRVLTFKLSDYGELDVAPLVPCREARRSQAVRPPRDMSCPRPDRRDRRCRSLRLVGRLFAIAKAIHRDPTIIKPATHARKAIAAAILRITV